MVTIDDLVLLVSPPVAPVDGVGRGVLHPTADRGGYDSRDGRRQDRFKAITRGWLLSYENHGIPPSVGGAVMRRPATPVIGSQ